MWEPQPGWHPLPGGTGASTVGLWRAAQGGRPVVIKRLAAPTPADPAELSDPGHSAYWRREADVLATGLTAATPGLRSVEAAIEEDDQGITITREWVAGSDLPRPRFLARHLLGDRMARVERRGGWPTLARTTVADVAQHLWERRTTLLDLVEALPQVPQHGDPTPMNLPGRDGDEVLAIDWGTLGTGPVGGDLGYFSLGSREAFEPLLDAYLMGLPGGFASHDDVLLGARVTAVLTALNRAEWALARVAGGEGALAGKYRHPAVAPHLRALQRQFPQIEALLGW
jgi:hypothetical protein